MKTRYANATKIESDGPERSSAECEGRSRRSESTVVAVYGSAPSLLSVVEDLYSAEIDHQGLSVVARVFRDEEYPLAFYNAWGNRVGLAVDYIAIRGRLRSVPVSGVFFWIPGLGPLIVSGSLAELLAEELKGPGDVGGISALGWALTRIGVPLRATDRYEALLESHCGLIVFTGDSEDISRAQALMRKVEVSEVGVFN